MTSNWYERDYQGDVDLDGPTVMLPDTDVEIIHRLVIRQPPQHALFDFDGTLSLVREGWPEVMVPMMVEELTKLDSGESPEALKALVYDFVMQLNGKQTIYQMIRLCEEIEKRQGSPEKPLVYKQRYHARLMERISGRREALRLGEVSPDSMLVPHSRDLLDRLRERGVKLYLASGTDEAYVREEVELLQLDGYFGPHIYGACDDYRSFSKAKVIERLLIENNVEGAVLLGFGDGYVEIQNVKAVGGVAVGVASDESGRSGQPDEWKRKRLIGVGADVIVADYRHGHELLAYLWSDR